MNIGDRVRYQPGFGTYGYEHLVESDGCVPVTVVGFTRTRVRVELPKGRAVNGRSVVAVDAKSLLVVAQ